MKRVPLATDAAIALLALGTLAVGVYLVAGLGWSLIVAAVLVLAYVVLPDQRGAT
jgi:hypothetical protein